MALGWRTMESAPRDGTEILACCPMPRHLKNRRGRKWYYAVTWWRRKEDKAGYIGWGEFNEHSWPPTHWCPLDETGLPPPA